MLRVSCIHVAQHTTQTSLVLYHLASRELTGFSWYSRHALLTAVHIPTMNTSEIIDQFSEMLAASLENIPSGLSDELRKNSHTLFQRALDRLDLVTREEFDAQTAVLERTREKLEQMEQTVAQLIAQQQ